MNRKSNIMLAWYASLCLLIIAIAVVVVGFSRKNVSTLRSFVGASDLMTSSELPMNNIAFELNRRFAETGRRLSLAIETGEPTYLDSLTNQVWEIEHIVKGSFSGTSLDPELASIISRFGAYVNSGQAIALAYIEDSGKVEPSELAAVTGEIMSLRDDLRSFQAKHAQRLDERLHGIGEESRVLSHEHSALVAGVAIVAFIAVLAAVAASIAAMKLVASNERLRIREEQLRESNEELRRHEVALRERSERLEEALSEIKKAQERLVHHERMDALGRMASGVAHDFNNILTPIIGYTDLLLALDSFSDTTSVKGELETILTAALNGQSVVERLREFYRTDEEQVCEPVNVADLLGDVITLTKPVWQVEASGDGWAVEVKVEADDELGVMVNRMQLHQVLTNLVINAVDAMPKGGVITLSGRQCAGEAVITVSDTGEGMSPDVVARCWEPFFTTKGKKGTGMGLSICRDIIEAFKGRVSLESHVGRGTEISMFLPSVRVAASLASKPHSEPVHVAEPESAAAGKVENLRILVVDDEPMITRLIAKTLGLLGHTVESAHTASEALSLIQKNAYDLVLTDKDLPDADGGSVAAAAKQLKKPLPVIMLTGFGDMGELYGELRDHVDLVISKPADGETLRRGIAAVMTS